ncbi:MAG: penicillin-binding protein 2 [Lachnospiraceae bacterium]|nr:penicillin-binding protein 2 [Lachnospiraceae bacterium]
MKRIRAVSNFFTVLMLALCVYLCLYSALSYRKLFDNDYNGRTRLLSGQNRRGDIYSSDGYLLAHTAAVVDDTGNITEKREYPFGSIFAHIVGYSAYGRSGIEDLEDYYLVRSNISLSKKAEYAENSEKYPGNTVITSLNAMLQCAAEEALRGYRGAIIVSEPATGRILACVSKPDFDPNTIAENWENITSDNSSGSLINRATQGLYPPGSTFKILDAAAFIEQDQEAAGEYSYECTGSITRDGQTISCYHGDIHYTVDFTDSFVRSCNCSFANIGLLLDRPKFFRLLDGLYFNRPLPFDLPAAISRAPKEAGSDADIMQLSIGQGTLVMTPLHMNMITAAIANRGIMMQPYVIDSVVTAQGDDLTVFHPRELKRAMSSTAAEMIASMMEETVLGGTARGIRNERYTAAGKTGSAEYSDTGSQSHAWFTGYAPAEDPRICITVVLEGAGSGSQAAVPAAKHVMDAWFDTH